VELSLVELSLFGGSTVLLCVGISGMVSIGALSAGCCSTGVSGTADTSDAGAGVSVIGSDAFGTDSGSTGRTVELSGTVVSMTEDS
jgi:hypothetical protein